MKNRLINVDDIWKIKINEGWAIVKITKCSKHDNTYYPSYAEFDILKSSKQIVFVKWNTIYKWVRKLSKTELIIRGIK